MKMVQEFRCDSCENPFPVNQLRPIREPKSDWFRCSDCVREWGTEPRSPGYYTQLKAKHIFSGLENPDQVIRFNP